MSITKTLVLLALLAGCGATGGVATPDSGTPDAGTPDSGMPDMGPPATGDDVTGSWVFTMTPNSRVLASVPAPCSGLLTLAEVSGEVSGDWSCDNGTAGFVEGTRYGTTVIALRIAAPGIPADGNTLLNTLVTVWADRLIGAGFTAARAD